MNIIFHSSHIKWIKLPKSSTQDLQLIQWRVYLKHIRFAFPFSLLFYTVFRLHYSGRQPSNLTSRSTCAALQHTSHQPFLCYLMHNLVPNLTVFTSACFACRFSVSRTSSACIACYFYLSAHLLLIGNCWNLSFQSSGNVTDRFDRLMIWWNKTRSQQRLYLLYCFNFECSRDWCFKRWRKLNQAFTPHTVFLHLIWEAGPIIKCEPFTENCCRSRAIILL